MARIPPIPENDWNDEIRKAFSEHVGSYNARITNMKATLGHSRVAFEAYMHWYPLYRETELILGKRLSYLFAFSISTSSNCPLCSTFFRKIIIDAGEDPAHLVLTDYEKKILDFGALLTRCNGHIVDVVYDDVAKYHSRKEMVILVAFAGQMIATNIFNNILETDIDNYLSEYLPPIKSIWTNG